MGRFLSDDVTDIHIRVRNTQLDKWVELKKKMHIHATSEFVRMMVERGIVATKEDMEKK